jgi:hypothetical protein
VHLVQDKNPDCTAVAVITEDDVDVHTALDAAGCKCCPQDHHHGQAANEPGAVPCRPVTITMVPGSAEVAPAGGA